MQGFEPRIPRGQANTVSVNKDVTSPAHSPLPSDPRVRLYTKNVVKLLKTPYSIQFVLRFDPATDSEIHVRTLISVPVSKHSNILYWLRYSLSIGMTFSNAVSKLKAQSSNVSFATFQWKETFELGDLSLETAFENVTTCEIGWTSIWIDHIWM